MVCGEREREMVMFVIVEVVVGRDEDQWSGRARRMSSSDSILSPLRERLWQGWKGKFLSCNFVVVGRAPGVSVRRYPDLPGPQPSS